MGVGRGGEARNSGKIGRERRRRDVRERGKSGVCAWLGKNRVRGENEATSARRRNRKKRIRGERARQKRRKRGDRRNRERKRGKDRVTDRRQRASRQFRISSISSVPWPRSVAAADHAPAAKISFD